MDLQVLGWIGTAFLALCMAPQTIETLKTKEVGMNGHSIIYWFIGLVLMAIYTPLQLGWDWPLMTNYIVNLAMGAVLIKYKFFK